MSRIHFMDNIYIVKPSPYQLLIAFREEMCLLAELHLGRRFTPKKFAELSRDEQDELQVLADWLLRELM